ncbi:Protein CBG25848 [Caenorhabditis briggsae]|uniref:Protein CBG25848 n=1 Tax=Caenorhabditis briggsae TaxID=6238 RepID=B6IHB9_CAEBR|nr:Protein CBG25848 [Caenorhabditis briggsae]CAR99299.1 Protein CBG25848 [Caenorhabditis briggsae]
MDIHLTHHLLRNFNTIGM